MKEIYYLNSFQNGEFKTYINTSFDNNIKFVS